MPIDIESVPLLTKLEILYWSRRLHLTPSQIFSLSESELEKHMELALLKENTTSKLFCHGPTNSEEVIYIPTPKKQLRMKIPKLSPHRLWYMLDQTVDNWEGYHMKINPLYEPSAASIDCLLTSDAYAEESDD